MLQLVLVCTLPNNRKASIEAFAQEGEGTHWKICLAQNMCEARIVGVLTFEGMPILGTEFDINCRSNYPIEPLGAFDTNFVFWKVWAPPGQFPTDIEFDKWIDADKDGYYEIGPIHISDLLTPPSEEEPDTWYQDLETGTGPFGPWMVVVEVRQQQYDSDNPFFEWQLTVKQENVSVICDGDLTLDGAVIPETHFTIMFSPFPPFTRMQCQVVRTPWCTVPNDIEFELTMSSTQFPFDIIDYQVHHLLISQFPWTFVKMGFDPYTGENWEIQLELTEVEMHRYYVMGGAAAGTASFGGLPEPQGTVPFHTRPPYLSPGATWQNITFTQRDPITGIVKLGVPAGSFEGIDHVFYSTLQGLYIRVQLILEEQGCGYLFTGVGKNPILGDVDIYTWNNNTGVYTLGSDGIPHTPDDQFIELGPCLRQVSGLDGIPGTGDPGDIFGDGTVDPKGSSILYLPTKLDMSYYDGGWQPLCMVSFPMLMTTALASDTVIEPLSSINGVVATETGHPWRHFFDGLPWDDPDCNLKVTYACSWSKLNIPAANATLSQVDIILPIREYKVREDRYTYAPWGASIKKGLRGDVNLDQIVDFKDIYLVAQAFATDDEGLGTPNASPWFDARCDHWYDSWIDLYDVVVACRNYRYIHGFHNVSSYQGTISVNPPSVTANVGETFQVDIMVSDVTDLYLVLFGIQWDPQVLNLTDESQGPFPLGLYGKASVYASSNTTAGYLEGWTGLLLGAGGGGNGGGTVATLTFEAIGMGSSALDLYECSWMDSTTGQYGFTAIQDGTFDVETQQVYSIIWKWINASGGTPITVWYAANVAVDSDYPVANFNFSRSLEHISFDITSTGSGYCNITIPKNLMSGAFKVLANGTEMASLTTWNRTHTSVYFTYGQGTHNFKIKAEIFTVIRGFWQLTDVDGNGIVDIFDIVAVALDFGWEEDC